MKNRITIRYGAGVFEAAVNLGDRVKVYDIRSMNKKQEHAFRKELVAQFREAGEVA